MNSSDLYIGPDRGHFKVIRLLDHQGVQQMASCRIKEAKVFNYLSDLQYAVVGYKIEWWKNGEAAPHEGGEARPYHPLNRPQVETLYFRTKTSITPNMLHLEDAIINDFLNNKVLADPMSLRSFSEEAKEQVASAAMWRVLEGSPYSYANAVHTTTLMAAEQTPLTVVSQGIRTDWRETGTDDTHTVKDEQYPFTKLRACYDKLYELIAGEDL